MKSLIFFLALVLSGCGDRITDAEDNTDALLAGLWDSITNDAWTCHDRLRLNSDKTFWWYSEGALSSGTYGRASEGLNFEFTDAAWEIIQFDVTDRELVLFRLNQRLRFTRVPMRSGISPCPGKPRPKNPEQNPEQNPGQKPPKNPPKNPENPGQKPPKNPEQNPGQISTPQMPTTNV